MTDPGTLADALSEVRKAYRLLHAYHRRLAELLRLVDDELKKDGFEFERWEPEHVARPAKKFFAREHWVWDLLQGAKLRCEWTQTTTGGARRVVIVATADTGIDGSHRGEPDPAEFPAPEACATELWVEQWRAGTSAPTWDAAGDRLDGEGDASDGRVEIDGVAYARSTFTVDLVDLPDAVSAKTKLVERMRSWFEGSTG